MKLRVGAVFIPVRNLEDSIPWYTECLELQLADNWGTGASFTFKEGESLLALIQVEHASPLEFPVKENYANVYYHFETDNLNQLRSHCEKMGIEIVQSFDHGMMDELFIRDPSGNRLAFYCEKQESPFYQHAKGKISW